MPNIEDLSPKDRKALLGCIAGKNKAWQTEHDGADVPAEVNRKHFTECADNLGLEGYAAELSDDTLKTFASNDLPTEDLQNVEIFAAGTWTDSSGNKKTFTNVDIDRMVENHRALKDKIKPFLKLMHLSDKDHRRLTAAPSLGWMRNLRRIGTKLVADFSNVPAKVAKLIRAGSYRRISAEIFPSFKDEATGKTYRHVVCAAGLLGATTPAVTTLDDVFKLFEVAMEGETMDTTAVADSALGWSDIVIDTSTPALCFYESFCEEVVEGPGIHNNPPKGGGAMTIEEALQTIADLKAKISSGTASSEAVNKFASGLRKELGLGDDADVTAALKLLKRDNEAKDKRIAAAEKTAFSAEIDTVFAEAKKSGKLTPAEESMFRTLADSWNGKKDENGNITVDYGEDKFEGTPVGVLKQIFESRPKVISLERESGRETLRGKRMASAAIPDDIARNMGSCGLPGRVIGTGPAAEVIAYQHEHKCDFMPAWAAVTGSEPTPQPSGDAGVADYTINAEGEVTR